MFSDQVTNLLKEISSATQATGRRIQSPKNDIDDLRILAETLGYLRGGLEAAIRIEQMRQN